jgi:hypothetical protein
MTSKSIQQFERAGPGYGFRGRWATAGNVPIGYDRGHDGGADRSDPRDRNLVRRFAIAGIGAISLAFEIVLICEFAFGRSSRLAARWPAAKAFAAALKPETRVCAPSGLNRIQR